MQHQIDWLSAGVLALFTSIAGHLFDVPPSVLWVAFIGASAGVAASETTTRRALLMILIVTPATGWLLPFAMYFLPDPAIKGLAFLTAFILVAYWPAVRGHLPRLIDAVFDRLISIIRGPRA